MRLLILAMFINVATLAQGVGDIPFDPAQDNKDFKLCNDKWVWQGYWLKTKMDETSITVEQTIRSNYHPKDEWKNESGIIRVRFLVNCQGQSDRYRLLELDFDLKEKKFSESLRAHVMSVAKQIQWPARRNNHQEIVDYYHHFTLRITNGQLSDVVQ